MQHCGIKVGNTVAVFLLFAAFALFIALPVIKGARTINTQIRAANAEADQVFDNK